MKSQLPNILIACDNTLAAIGLKSLITEVNTTVTVTAVTEGNELSEKLKENNYACIFVNENIYKQENNGVYRVLNQLKNTEWFILGSDTENRDVMLDVRLPEQDIVKFLRKVFDKKNNSGAGTDNALSVREQEVLKCVALGMTNKEISEKLYISSHTVITHRKNITSKLDIKTIPGLTIYAILNKIINADEVNF